MRWEKEKEQQIYVNIEKYDEAQRRCAESVYKWLWIPSDRMEPDSTERENEEWTDVWEQQVVEQAEES